MIFETEVRKVFEIEIRVEAKNPKEAQEKAIAIAAELPDQDWWDAEIVVNRVGRAYDHQEHAIRYEGDFLVCECGNNVNEDGFLTTDTGGVEVEPEPDKWDGKTFRCDRCGSVKSVDK
jgi:hypothetical protein